MSEAVRKTGGTTFRPIPARWFELLTAREDITVTVETLGHTGSVELETHSEATRPLILGDLGERLADYHRLADRYHAWWPEHGLRPSGMPGRPDESLDRALAQLHAWRSAADPRVARLEALHSERADLSLFGEMLDAMADTPLRLDLLPHAGPAVAVRAFVLPRHSRIAQIPPGVITLAASNDTRDFLLALGPPEEMTTLEQELSLLKGRPLTLSPQVVAASTGESRKRLAARQRELEGQERDLDGEMETLQAQFSLHEMLGDIARIEWLVTHVESLPASENFAWVTGWTSDLGGERIRTALEHAGVRALLRFPEPPRGKRPPMVLHNPHWVQPFELFARLLGTPSETEADPSRLLVFITPLLFGYMFGDVGQGLVLFAAGLTLSRRWPILRLLVPGGLASVAFGFLFGSLFSREGLLTAQWVVPLEQPVTILAVPLAAGAGILLLGLVLAGVQAHWRGAGRLWWRVEAALLPIYAGLLASLFHPTALLLSAAGCLWYVAGSLAGGRNRLSRLGRNLGSLLEAVAQLAINTISFARVGAFALAHAGLSAAVTGLADGSGNLASVWVIMIAGNAVIILLEGLVVAVQLTRLVLFEFFIRFLKGEGRAFHPLSAPPRAG